VKPAPSPSKPAPVPKPEPAPSKPSGPSTAKSFLDGFQKYGPAAFEWGTKLVQQFTGPGGGKISGQQALDLARGAGQQVAGFAGDQPAAPPPPPPDTGQPPPFASAAGEPPAISSVTPVGAPPAAAAVPPTTAAPTGYATPPGYGAPYPLSGAGTASPYAAWPQPAAGGDTLGLLLQALQQRQVPPLPGPYAQPTAVPQHNAMTLLSLMLANPNLQRTLQTAHMTGVPPRSVDLPVPASTAPVRTRQVQIPLGAVMNALTALAGQAMTELNESTPEDDPEMPSYLVGDDGDYLVDPADPNDRAALVAYLFRLNDEVERNPYAATSEAEYTEDEAAAYAEDEEAYDPDKTEDEQDETEAWAAEAGFI
jgi:hypothetical protein